VYAKNVPPVNGGYLAGKKQVSMGGFSSKPNPITPFENLGFHQSRGIFYGVLKPQTSYRGVESSITIDYSILQRFRYF